MRLALTAIVMIGAAAAQQLTYERIRNAASEPGSWLTYHGDYKALRHRDLNQINTENVKNLRCRVDLPNRPGRDADGPARSGRCHVSKCRRRDRRSPRSQNGPAVLAIQVQPPSRPEALLWNHQSRRRYARRTHLHDHSGRASRRNRRPQWQAALGHRDGRLASGLRRDHGAARS